MAFSNINDARTKLKDTETDVDSQILYANNNLLDSTTIFYTNSAKTILASAGNYVIPTQFKTYYVTLGSDGKIVTDSKKELTAMETGSTWEADATWVDYSIMNYTGDQGVQMANDRGVSYTLDSTSLLLTDTTWESNKRWVIDSGVISTSPITNINLSAMKGYDLVIRSGYWGSVNGITGFVNDLLFSSIIHIAADSNRRLIGTLSNGGDDIRINYYFRPDYWIPKLNKEYPSFFRRMPDTLPIYDRSGIKKEWISMTNMLLDCVVKDSGTPGSTSRTFRNPKRQNKGYTKMKPAYLKNLVYGEVSQLNSNYLMIKETDGSNSNNITQIVPIAQRLKHDGDDFWIASPASFIKNLRTGDGTINGNNSIHESWCCALLESLLITNPTERTSWQFSNSWLTISYENINPYHWTTVPNEGLNYLNIAPANNFLKFFRPTNSGYNTLNYDHATNVEFDAEKFIGVGMTRKEVGLSIDSIWANCKTYSIAQGWYASGSEVFPVLSNYANSIYLPGYFGADESGWNYVDPSYTVAQVKTKPLYYDYHNYYINGSVNRSTMINFHVFYEGAKNSYGLFAVTDYLKQMVTKWFYYNLVHSYDISKKLLLEICGTELAKQKRVIGYAWRLHETVNYLSDFRFEEKGYDYWDGTYGTFKTQRPVNPPSHNQSLAVWSFAYMDGLYQWDDPNCIGGEYNHGFNWIEGDPAPIQDNFYGYGSVFELDNGCYDWYHIGYWQVMQNKDIVGADTPWLKPELKIDSTTWTSNTDADTSNYPVMLYNRQRPISAYKMSADGTEALLIMTSPFNNGYTKENFTVRLPAKSYQEFSIDVWGNYTTVVRLKGL